MNTKANSQFKSQNVTKFKPGGSLAEGYTVIINPVMNDIPRIGTTAFTVLAKIFQYIHNPEHIISIAGLSKQIGISKTSISKAIHRLIECGYIERNPIYNDKYPTLINGYEYLVYDRPIENTRTERSPQNSDTENSDTNTRYANKENSNYENKKKENKDVDDAPSKLDRIKNLFNDYKVQKRIIPQMTKLFEKYEHQFSLDVWEHIFVQASEDSVDKKYSYIKKLTDDYYAAKIRTAKDLDKYNQDYVAKRTTPAPKRTAPKRGFNAYNVDLKERYTPDQLEKVLQDNKPSTGVEPTAIVDEHSWNTLSDSDKLNAYNTKKANGLFIPDFMRDFIDKL